MTLKDININYADGSCFNKDCLQLSSLEERSSTFLVRFRSLFEPRRAGAEKTAVPTEFENQMNIRNQIGNLVGCQERSLRRKGALLVLAGTTMIALTSPAALINIDFNGGSYQNGIANGPTQTGAAVVGSPGDVWNGFIDDAPSARTGEPLVDSSGAATGVTLDYRAGFNYDSMSWGTSPFVTAGSPVADLMVEFLGAGAGTTATLTLNGLTAGQYDLYLYSAPDAGNAQTRVTTFRVDGLTNSVGPNNGSGKLTEGANYVHMVPAVASDGLLTISFDGGAGEGDLNGFQIRPAVLGAKPFFTAQPTPASVTRFAHGSVTFAAAVDGTQPISVQWRHGGSDVTGATNTTLTLTNLSAGDVGNYTLVASNAFGATASQAVTLNLTAPPATFVVSFDFDCGGDLWPGTYSGEGVVGTGSYWNSVPGPNNSAAGTYVSTSGLAMDGVTETGVSLTAESSGNWAGRGASLLLDDFACAYTSAGQPFRLTGVPDGLYNLVLFGVNAPYSDFRGTIFTVNGESKATVNATVDPVTFVEGDNYVRFNNLLVTSGVIVGNWAPNPVPHGGSLNAEGDFNGAQLQRVGDVTAAIAPTISSDPRSATVYEQWPATFSVSGSGSPAPTFQWQKNGLTIAGATTSACTFTSVSAADAGEYLAVLSNSAGSITSSVATLTVLSAPAAPAPSSFGAAVLASAPLAFWRLSDSTGTQLLYDSAGNHAAINQNVTLGAAGPQAPLYPGFPATTKAAAFDGTNSAVTTGLPLVNGLSSFTLMGWLNPAGPNADRVGIFGQNDALEFGFNDTDGVYLWIPTTIGGWVNPKTGPEGFMAGTWYFVALVADGRDIAIYINGTQRARIAGVGAPSGFSANGFNIGGGGILDATGNNFNGSIADVALFDRALSDAQLNNLYNVAAGLIAPSIVTQPAAQSALQGFPVRLSIAVAGTPLSYQWQAGPANGPYTNLLENGQFSNTCTATLLLPNATLGQAASYRVIVTNAAGSVTSEVATVAVEPLAAPWTVNFDFDCSEGGFVGTFASPGVVGTGSYWNSIPGPSSWEAKTYTSQGGLTDDGITDTKIALILTTGGSWSYTPVSNALLDDYATADSAGKPFLLNNIPDGRYNVAVFSVDGGWHDRGSFISVGGQTRTTVNTTSASFVENDNYVLFTNIVARGGLLSGTYAANPAVHGGNNNEAQFCGAQLQYLGPAPATIPTVNVQVESLANGQIKVQWSNGTLMQCSDLATGSWSAVQNATSPYTATPSASRMFYRVKVQ
jgi:hypothetical protein